MTCAVHDLVYVSPEASFVLSHQMASQHVKHLRARTLDDGYTS
ncbi:hypothetical protein [Agrobacterium larrymoorei]|nr:hypothetical protein [Agrobacterium larrymoorei]